MIDEKKLNKIRELVSDIDYHSSKNSMDPELFRLSLQCFSRAPSVSIEKIHEFLCIIKFLLDAKMDYSLLLKAGILTGAFSDYLQYKKQRNQKNIHNKKMEKANAELEAIGKQLDGYSCDISNGILSVSVHVPWLNELKSLFVWSLQDERFKTVYQEYWKRLNLVKKETAESLSPETVEFGDYDSFIERWLHALRLSVKIAMNKISKKLNLSPEIWAVECTVISDMLVPQILVYKKSLEPCFRMMEEKNFNRYDSDSIFSAVNGRSHVILNDWPTAETLTFISIYQKSLLDPNAPTISKQLETHFIATHKGKSPTLSEMTALRQRYYRYIQKAYSAEVRGPDYGEKKYHALVPVQTRRKDIFYLYSGKNDASRYLGKLRLNQKTRQYWLLPSSILSKLVNETDDLGIKNLVRRNVYKHTVKQLENETYRVLKKIEMHSPSQAAWLVSGYKRNGLKVWKNYQGEMLGDVLSEKKERVAHHKTDGNP